ncbi:uncharacterized protein LOC111369059 [Olea europaea var. sylvestris]|uniref:uncharacterized protein LOC111369059 n=1 Tax=Olea europaea var. sylvestris TaxID=158386 RepID=UPI000C1D0122|nr:uncharacterized protein LOC111369059 [Olea europaea var. sylvestris]
MKYWRHNQDIAQILERHSYAKRLTEKETLVLTEMSKNHMRLKDILYIMKQNYDTNVSILRHKYNAHQKFKLKEQARRTQMQKLMNRLDENKYIEWYCSHKETNIIRDLSLAHPYSVDLLPTFPCVIIMGCINKTNRYCLPLLKIVGVTSNDLTFSGAITWKKKVNKIIHGPWRD